jgi:hypothetical protein
MTFIFRTACPGREIVVQAKERRGGDLDPVSDEERRRHGRRDPLRTARSGEKCGLDTEWGGRHGCAAVDAVLVPATLAAPAEDPGEVEGDVRVWRTERDGDDRQRVLEPERPGERPARRSRTQ